MEWPPSGASNGSIENWTYLLGETVANSRTILADVRDMKTSLKEGEARMDFLTEENIRRQSEIQTLQRECPAETSWLGTFPKLAETAETVGGVLRVLGTVKEVALWAVSGTAIYQMLTSPLWVKQLGHAILAMIGLS